MSYNNLNPIHWIKGKRTIEDQMILKKHILKKENFKRLKLTLLMYVIPFVYLYLVLIFASQLDSIYRVIFYIPAIVVFMIIRRKRIIYESMLIGVCNEREKNIKGN